MSIDDKIIILCIFALVFVAMGYFWAWSALT